MVAELNHTTKFICGPKWDIAKDLSIYDGTATESAKGIKVGGGRSPSIVWPAPFGCDLTKEEGKRHIYTVLLTNSNHLW